MENVRRTVELPDDHSLLSMLDFADRVEEASKKYALKAVGELLKSYMRLPSDHTNILPFDIPREVFEALKEGRMP